jgi:neutral/alkaline ceramidase-like enzyme
MSLKVGAAKIDITPLVPVPLAGYVAIRLFDGGPEDHRNYLSRVGVSEGVHDLVHARAVAFASDTATAVVVGLDLCIVPLEFTRRVRMAASSRWGIDPDGILLAASHSHSGPDYTGQWESVDPAVQDYIAELTISAIGHALASARPAKIGWGEGSLVDPLINRRDADRPVDPRVSVIRADDENGQPIAILYCFACHPIVVGSANRLVSAEFPGYSSNVIEVALSGNPVALFLNGAAGNINPVAFPYSERLNISNLAKEYNRTGRTVTFRDHPDALRLGQALGGEVIKVASMIATADSNELSYVRQEIQAELKPSEELDRYLYHLGIPDKTAERLRRQRYIQTEVMAIRLGQSILVCMPGEPFVEIGLELQSMPADLSNLQLRVVGYANDYPGYVIRAEDYAENRYETISTPLSSAGAQLIVSAARKLRDDILRMGHPFGAT